MTSSFAIDGNDIYSIARAYTAAGLSVIPVRIDGSKAPRFPNWREYSERRPTYTELHDWYATGCAGIGIPGGPASGNLVAFDFEARNAFDRWCVLLTADDRAHLANCPVVRTPSGGFHIYCRLTESVKGSKLAKDAAGKCLIETRGNGHFVVAPGSPASCHPSGRRYQLMRPGWLDRVPFEPIPIEVFLGLTVYAAELNEYVRPVPREVVGERSGCGSVGDRPGDDFSRRVGWDEILSPHGWRVYRTTSTATYWCRPDRSPPGISASTGFCKGPSTNDLLYVFSTNAVPFEAERSYSKFAAYAVLNHHGDFAAATRALVLAGYGRALPTSVKGVRR